MKRKNGEAKTLEDAYSDSTAGKSTARPTAERRRDVEVQREAKWREWEHKCDEIFRLLQVRRNLRLNLWFDEFISEISKATKVLYNKSNHQCYLNNRIQLLDSEKDSFYLQVAHI